MPDETIPLKPNRAYPSLPSVGGDLASHTIVLKEVKEAVEQHERRRGDPLDSFVRLRELIDVGVLARLGDRVVAAEDTVFGGSVETEFVQDTIGGILTDTSEINLTYNGTTPSITATLIDGSIALARLSAGVQASLLLADTAVQPGDEIPDADLTANVALLDRTPQTFTGANIFSQTTTFNNTVDLDSSSGLTALDVGGGGVRITGAISSGTLSLLLEQAIPRMGFLESDAAADNRLWYIDANAEQFAISVVNDARTVVTDAFRIDRTGTTIDLVQLLATGGEIDLTATTLDFNGAADISGTLAVGGAATLASTIVASGTARFGRTSIGEAPGGRTFTIADTDAFIRFTETTTPPANEGVWLMGADANGEFHFYTRTDADGTGATIFSVTRTGTVVDIFSFGSPAIGEFEVNATTIDFNGAMDVSGALTVGGLVYVPGAFLQLGASGVGTAAELSIWDGDNGTNQKGFVFGSGAGLTGHYIGTRLDNGSFGEAAMRLTVNSSGQVTQTELLGDTVLLTGSSIVDMVTPTARVSNADVSLHLRDTSGTASDMTTYFSLRDSSSAERGWIGFGESNTRMRLRNAIGDIWVHAVGSVEAIGTMFRYSGGSEMRLFNDGMFISFYNTAGSARRGYVQATTGGTMYVHSEESGQFLRLVSNAGGILFNTSNAIGQDAMTIDSAGQVEILDVTGSLLFNVQCDNSSPWAMGITRSDIGLNSKVFLHNSPYNGWYFEHNIIIAGETNWHSGNDGTGSGLDADLLDGYHAAEAASGSTVVARHASGYVFATYYNQSSGNNENPTISQFFVDNGSDGYLRKASIAHTAISIINNRDIFNATVHTYGNHYIQGTSSGYVGLGLNDGGIYPTFMSNNTHAGLYMQGIPGWIIYYNAGSVHTEFQFSSAGDITAFSDRNLKRDLLRIESALDKVERLTGYTFARTDERNNRRHTGLIAQDVEAVLPEAVTTMSDGIKSLAYGNLAGLFAEAIKELRAEVRGLARVH